MNPTLRRKSLLVAALLAATATAWAQTPPAAPAAGASAPEAPRAHRGMERPPRTDGQPGRMEPRMQERMQRHLGELKQKLKIEPAQEAAWTAWTTAMKPPADMRQRGEQMRAEMDKLSTPERIDRMKALRAQRDTEMDKRAQATKDFYAQLNAEQKKTFDSHRPMRHGPGMMGGMHGQAGGHDSQRGHPAG